MAITTSSGQSPNASRTEGISMPVPQDAVHGLPQVVTRDAWVTARKAFLAREKAFDRQRDALSAARRQLPMVPVESAYVFAGPDGAVSLRDLFGDRRQLIVYHFMFAPGQIAGCKHCACVMDSIAGGLVHLAARDTAFAAISRAPITTIEPFRQRMQWSFPWVSSFGNPFNIDYQVTLDPASGHCTYNFADFPHPGEMPGLSVFLRDGDRIFHTYSTYMRGLDIFISMYHLLDATPLGRQEEHGMNMTTGDDSWIRLHDEYTAKATAPALGKPTCCND